MDIEHKRILWEKAMRIRLGVINGVESARCGHPGGSLSIADILSVLYFGEMNIDPTEPNKSDRDRLVLSKGHAAPALYAALAERGYFDVSDLTTLRKLGSHLQGHPDMRKTPGVDMSTGSLGQGLSAACGMALVAKRECQSWRVYAIVGDGETQEGQIWEALNTAAHFALDNLTVFFDLNGLQIDGQVESIMNVYPLEERLKAFRWSTISVDGHDIDALLLAVEEAKSTFGKPTAILCHTIKGKGVSYMENQVGWHGIAPNADQAAQARAELLGSLTIEEGSQDGALNA